MKQQEQQSGNERWEQSESGCNTHILKTSGEEAHQSNTGKTFAFPC